jgi:hypothetical protein
MGVGYTAHATWGGDGLLMDTDCLTHMAYEIIIKADEILDVLKTEIGASCARYNSEESFLKGTLQFIESKIRDPESYLDFWNCIDEIDVDQFKKDLKGLKRYIIEVIETPLSERGEPPFK